MMNLVSLKLPKTKLTTTITTRIFTGLRHLSADTTTVTTPEAKANTVRKEYIFQKLFELGHNGGDVSSVLHRTIRSGKQIPKYILIHCLKDLRKFNRYQHCLQILDWMEKGRYDYSSTDFALRVDIMCKHKGLAEAEKCFDGIPSDMKNRSVYGALLNCYCTELATDKALALFNKMDDMGYASHFLPFNNLLSLYVKLGQPEKVAELIADMKARDVPLSSHSYSFWIQSLRLVGDLEGVERVFHEAQENAFVKDNYIVLANVASVFIEFNQMEKAISHLKNLENVLDNSNKTNRNTYHHLMTMYATAGDLEAVIRVWNKLKPKFKVTRLSYLALLQALSKVDDIEGMEKYFQEWESSGEKYDDRLPAALIGAYLKHDKLEEAERLLKDAKIKGGKLRAPHVKFMNYYFEKHQTENALKHMEIAVDSKWKPVAEKLDPCFEYFKVEKDVDGAENFCRILKKAQSLDSKAYIWLLQLYVDAGKTSIDMRQRVEEDGISITTELDVLLEQVCPNRF